MEDFIYIDSRLSGGKSKPRKTPDSRLIVTVAPHSNRIYFSAGLARKLTLDRNRVSFVISNTRPHQLYLYPDNAHGFELTSYRWCYYLNSKETVQKIMDSIYNDMPEGHAYEFIVGPRKEKIDNKPMYPIKLLNIQHYKSDRGAEFRSQPLLKLG